MDATLQYTRQSLLLQPWPAASQPPPLDLPPLAPPAPQQQDAAGGGGSASGGLARTASQQLAAAAAGPRLDPAWRHERAGTAACAAWLELRMRELGAMIGVLQAAKGGGRPSSGGGAATPASGRPAPLPVASLLGLPTAEGGLPPPPCVAQPAGLLTQQQLALVAPGDVAAALPYRVAAPPTDAAPAAAAAAGPGAAEPGAAADADPNNHSSGTACSKAWQVAAEPAAEPARIFAALEAAEYTLWEVRMKLAATFNIQVCTRPGCVCGDRGGGGRQGGEGVCGPACVVGLPGAPRQCGFSAPRPAPRAHAYRLPTTPPSAPAVRRTAIRTALRQHAAPGQRHAQAPGHRAPGQPTR
jgi:hypothetical protein